MIFISYSHKNNDAAAEIKKKLSERKYNCFLAHDDVAATEDWHEEIWAALRKCYAFIGLVTKEFNSSAFCQQEMGAALALKRPSILVRMDGESVPGFAARFQAVKPLKLLAAITEQPKFRQLRVETWIHETENALSYRGANDLYDRFSSEWDAMTEDEKLRWLVSAASTSEVRTENFKVGPFYERKRKELKPLLTDEWLFDHDKKGVLHDIESNPVASKKR